jgi:hypothetical protein
MAGEAGVDVVGAFERLRVVLVASSLVTASGSYLNDSGGLICCPRPRARNDIYLILRLNN